MTPAHYGKVSMQSCVNTTQQKEVIVLACKLNRNNENDAEILQYLLFIKDNHRVYNERDRSIMRRCLTHNVYIQ